MKNKSFLCLLSGLSFWGELCVTPIDSERELAEQTRRFHKEFGNEES